MLFLLGLSSDILERKMILYLSLVPFIGFIISSIHILQNRPIKKSIKNTENALILLIVIMVIVFIDVAILDNFISKLFEYSFDNIIPINDKTLIELLNKTKKINIYN